MNTIMDDTLIFFDDDDHHGENSVDHILNAKRSVPCSVLNETDYQGIQMLISKLVEAFKKKESQTDILTSIRKMA